MADLGSPAQVFQLQAVLDEVVYMDLFALMHEAIPFREFWVIVSGAVELIGAVLILTNRWPRLGAWLIVLFLIPVTFTVHGYEMVNAEDARMRAMQLSFFLKGLTMTGAALLFTQLGVRAQR